MASTVTLTNRRIAAGVMWVFASHFSLRLIGFARGIVLARLLAPDDFGVFSLASVAFGYIGAIRDAGASAYLIRVQDDEDRQAHAAFWYALGIACVLAMVAVAASPILGAVYTTPSLSPLIAVLALGFVIESAGSTHLALCTKKLRFRATTLVAVVANLAALVAASLLGLLGAGAWAFAAGSLVTSVVSCLLAWRAADWRPELNLGFELWPAMWRFGSRLLAAELVWCGLISLDSLLVGKLLGTEQLGFYTVAATYALALPGLIGLVLHEVRFPALASLQAEPDRLRQAYVRSMRLSVAAAVPVTLGLLVTGPSVLMLVLGPRWEPALAPFRILVLAGLMRYLLPDLAYALGRPDLELWIGLAWFAVLGVSIPVGLGWGLVGVAAAVSCSLAGYWLTSHVVACRLLNIRPGELVFA